MILWLIISAVVKVNPCVIKRDPWHGNSQTKKNHYDDVIMGAMASQISSLKIVYSTVYSDADQIKHLRVTGLCAGKSPGIGEFPTQMASNAENISISWRHHVVGFQTSMAATTELCVTVAIPMMPHLCRCTKYCHDDVHKWKHFPRSWPFVRGIHRSPVNSQHKGQWRGVLIFSLICVWINGWVNNGETGDLRRYRVHYNVSVMRRKMRPYIFNGVTCSPFAC